jgi:hypothetical protein
LTGEVIAPGNIVVVAGAGPGVEDGFHVVSVAGRGRGAMWDVVVVGCLRDRALGGVGADLMGNATLTHGLLGQAPCPCFRN